MSIFQDDIFALFTDNKGFTKRMLVESPPPRFYRFVDMPRLKLEVIPTLNHPESIPHATIAQFVLREVKDGIAYYVQE